MTGENAEPDDRSQMTRPEGTKPVFSKQRIIKEDGRYLIYYSFSEKGEGPDSRLEDGEHGAARTVDEAAADSSSPV